MHPQIKWLLFFQTYNISNSRSNASHDHSGTNPPTPSRPKPQDEFMSEGENSEQERMASPQMETRTPNPWVCVCFPLLPHAFVHVHLRKRISRGAWLCTVVPSLLRYKWIIQQSFYKVCLVVLFLGKVDHLWLCSNRT